MQIIRKENGQPTELCFMFPEQAKVPNDGRAWKNISSLEDLGNGVARYVREFETEIEFCIHCEREYEIDRVLKLQTCPGCGARIMACSYCNQLEHACDYGKHGDYCRFSKEANE